METKLSTPPTKEEILSALGELELFLLPGVTWKDVRNYLKTEGRGAFVKGALVKAKLAVGKPS
jgi:hypothetical protein